MNDQESLTWLRSTRLLSQRLVRPSESVPAAVDHLLALQAQEFWGGRWAISLRTKTRPTCATVDCAFNRGTLVRSWTMRGTLHIVLARDLPWILEATREFQLRARQSVLRSRGLSVDVLARATDVVRNTLEKSRQLTRTQLTGILAQAGHDCTGSKGSLILSTLAIEGLVAQGPVVSRPDGIAREQYFFLNRDLPHDLQTPTNPLSELFVRYAIGHGPVTADDFAWWAGIPKRAGQRAIEMAAGDARMTTTEKFGELYYLAARVPQASSTAPITALPAFDEYFLGYRDRRHACDPQFVDRIGPLANGIVRPSLLMDGEIRGTWHHSRAVTARTTTPVAEWFGPSNETTRTDAEQAFSRYTDFLA